MKKVHTCGLLVCLNCFDKEEDTSVSYTHLDVYKRQAKMIIELVPDEVMHKIPFFVRGHATKGTVAKIAMEYPELYAQAQQCDELQGELKEQLSKIINDIFCLLYTSRCV